MSHSADKICRRTLLCFERILVSKIFKQSRGKLFVLSKFFLISQDRKNFARERFCVSENFWYQKKLWIRGGISQFSVEIFMSHSAEKFRKGILLFLRKFLVSKSFMDEKGGYHVFPSEIFGLSAEKFRGHPFNVSENLGYRKILCIIGGITIFRRKFFVSLLPKNFVKEPFSVSLISGIKKC